VRLGGKERSLMEEEEEEEEGEEEGAGSTDW
jgi:hypothetical protein